MSERYSEQWLADRLAKRSLPVGSMVIVDEGPRPNKYRNKKTEVDGIVFDSKKEATRYQDLKVMQQVGIISGLTIKPKYPLIVNDVSVGKYIGDFRYIENGAVILEDVKALRTTAYRLKKRLVRAIYGIEIRET